MNDQEIKLSYLKTVLSCFKHSISIDELNKIIYLDHLHNKMNLYVFKNNYSGPNSNDILNDINILKKNNIISIYQDKITIINQLDIIDNFFTQNIKFIDQIKDHFIFNKKNVLISIYKITEHVKINEELKLDVFIKEIGIKYINYLINNPISKFEKFRFFIKKNSYFISIILLFLFLTISCINQYFLI